ncbi:MAG: hypothetical protein GY832_01480 [Chloroflexi bacterium]|nr:hypothetical protein [Chloroflexota bacterium]
MPATKTARREFQHLFDPSDDLVYWPSFSDIFHNASHWLPIADYANGGYLHNGRDVHNNAFQFGRAPAIRAIVISRNGQCGHAQDKQARK